MSGDTIECFNCGHANPSWAQVCRNCGFAIRPDPPPSGAPRGIFPTDQASLISIGGTLGAIVLAILVGLVFSGLIPPAPNVAAETPSPSPSATPLATISEAPSASASAAASAPSVVPLIGTVTFGTGINADTKEITGATTDFSAGKAFAHSIKLTEPFAVGFIQEEVVKVAPDGTETIVQAREGSDLRVTATSMIAGYRVSDAAKLIPGWGTGTFILRVYRGAELLAQGQFTLS